MNKRLLNIYSNILDGTGVIDVGTDHGYLPTALAIGGYRGNILASDIRKGPLETAIRTAETAGVAERIRFLFCNGLDLCPPELVDTIVVAGMGGDTICGILDRAEWCMDPRYKLLLQPMSKAEVLRYWLINNGFEICREELTEDGGILYPLIVARFGGQTCLTEAELFSGKLEMLRDSELFEQYLEHLLGRFRRAYAGLRSASVIPSSGKEEVLKSILDQLEEMRAHGNCE